ncbi:MAG TPA: AmmeMemoRadiSam system radical SAM enzyme, partial [Firmicutes bacterium]|nr:AmmeMemoRadiSam system radical SAM enzyme [Bacillota bacterium]
MCFRTDESIMSTERAVDRREFIRAAAVAAGGCALCSGLLPSSVFAQDPLPKGIDLSVDHKPQEDSMFVREARFYKKLEALRVECVLCPRRCQVADQERGYCGVRENREGTYYTLVHSRACTYHVDPIEKKPLFHFLPGTNSFSIATAGCNIECKFCQNWNISQYRPEQIRSLYLPPERLVEGCKQTHSKSLAFTYSEPVIFYEYMYDAAAAAKPAGIRPVMISNGYIEPEAMEELVPQLSGVKIDLKAFTEKFYRETCSGELKPVLDTLELLKRLGIWFEIVVLIVPTLNDSEEEIRQMCA